MVSDIYGPLRRAFLAILLPGFFLPVQAAPADISRGLAWLKAQVSPEGRMETEYLSAPLPQVRCETATTLLKLVGKSRQVIGLVANLHQSGPNVATQSLACEQWLRQQLGQTIGNPEVEQRHIQGQAYGAFSHNTVSSPLDTGWALRAQLQNLSSADKASVLAWLQANQEADGSFAMGGSPDILSTVAIVRGLQAEAAKNPVAREIATRAATYLLGSRNLDGNWLGSVAITALVFEAVQPYTAADPGIASGVATYLLSMQLPNGSWADDAFVTAVALRALRLSASSAKHTAH